MPVIRETYPATVTVNEDDEQRGRVRVACAGLMGDEESELPMWVEPAFDWGWFFVPDVGEIIEVELTSASEEDEHFGQASIDNLDIRWRGKRFFTEAEGTVGEEDQDPEVDARKVHAEFLTNYGKRRGFATPWGHIILFDDTDGDHRISISHSAEQLPHGEQFEDETKYSRLEIEPDGSIKAQLIGKHVFHFQTEGNKLLVTIDEEKHKIELDANVPKASIELDSGNHKLTLDGSAPSAEVSLGGGTHVLTFDAAGNSLTAIINGGAGMAVTDPDADTVTQLGDGAVSAVIAENLETWLNDTYTPAIADMHDTHFHPFAEYLIPLIPITTGPTLVGTAPGGAPMAPVVPASLENYDTGITSTHLVFPDA